MNMKRNFVKTSLAVLTASAVVLSGGLLANTTYAWEGKRNLEAFYKNIRIIYNNQEVAIDSRLEPFLLNGSTFIPLRYMGEVFDKEVGWDPVTYTVTVKDKKNTSAETQQMTINYLNGQVATLKKQLEEAQAKVAEKDKKIADLQKQVDSLKKQLSRKTEVDLDDLEDELNDDYKNYRDTNSSITLSGDKDKITVTIKVDANAWESLTTASKHSFLQDIVDDILDEAEDAEISGTVKSRGNSKVLLAFTVDDDEVVIDDWEGRMKDLEEKLNDRYGDYEDLDLTIELSGDTEDVTIKVTVDEEDWKDLSSSKQSRLQSKLVEDVKKEFDDANVKGYIYNPSGKRLKTFR